MDAAKQKAVGFFSEMQFHTAFNTVVFLWLSGTLLQEIFPV